LENPHPVATDTPVVLCGRLPPTSGPLSPIVALVSPWLVPITSLASRATEVLAMILITGIRLRLPVPQAAPFHRLSRWPLPHEGTQTKNTRARNTVILPTANLPIRKVTLTKPTSTPTTNRTRLSTADISTSTTPTHTPTFPLLLSRQALLDLANQIPSTTKERRHTSSKCQIASLSVTYNRRYLPCLYFVAALVVLQPTLSVPVRHLCRMFYLPAASCSNTFFSKAFTLAIL
jgi:hypothetical protein